MAGPSALYRNISGIGPPGGWWKFVPTGKIEHGLLHQHKAVRNKRESLCGLPSEGQQLARLLPFEVTGPIFTGDDSQAQTTSILKRSRVVQAAVHDVLNNEVP